MDQVEAGEDEGHGAAALEAVGGGDWDLLPGCQILAAASGYLAGCITWVPLSAQWTAACGGTSPSSYPAHPGPRATSSG